MWEQFSYYGMRALLVYYMTRELLFSQEKSSLVYGAYTATAYFTPILGGIVADRWLGKMRAVMVGGAIMAAGHFMMSFATLFYPALVTIALGNGLFLPSLPSQINDLYRSDDPRRHWAYNVYYVGINLGGFLAPLVCGTLGELYGWHWGFGAAGLGMLAGLAIYAYGRRYLPGTAPGARAKSVPIEDSRRALRPLMGALLGVCVAVTVFRAAYEQVGNTVALWAEVGVDRRAAGAVIPMTWFQSLNPLLISVLTPGLLAHWRRRARWGREPSSTRKMAMGALLVAGAYLLLAAVAAEAGPHRAGWLWLVAFFVILTWGELYILPTGLGLFGRLAPAGVTATVVAAWFLTIFTGSLAAGVVGTIWSSTTHRTFFLILAACALVSALMLLRLERAPVLASVA